MPRPESLVVYLWRHRDLVAQFTVRELQLRHRGSQLGHFWALLSPLSMLVLYLFVFGLIMGGRFGAIPGETTFDFALALFLGLSVYHTMAETVGAASILIVNQPNYVKKVVFPLEIIPVAHVIASFYHSLLSIGLLILVAPFSHAGISWLGLLQLPLLLLPLLMISMGLSWCLSSIGVYVRDISQLAPFSANAVMFASAVFYPPTKVPPQIWAVLKYNPLLQIIDQARNTLLWGHSMNWTVLLWVYVFAVFMLFAGYSLFRRLRPFFAEVL
jgi:lipopolysaccharide transport system permease protein